MPAAVPRTGHARGLRLGGSRVSACGVWRLAGHGVECDCF